MTTPWKAPDWKGQTVAVLGSASSMNKELAESFKEHRVIVVNETARLAPWADMLVRLDANWPEHMRAFKGIKATGIADPELDAMYFGHRFERVRISASEEIEIRNSGLVAIRLAVETGATRIILAGFQPETAKRWHDKELQEYPGLRIALTALTAELQARGITVEESNVRQSRPLPAGK